MPATDPADVPPPNPPHTGPVLVFDGDCGFCRLWIARWRQTTGDAVEYVPQQDPSVAQRFPGLDPAALREAVHLVEPGGRVTRGAEAVLRSLSHGSRGVGVAWAQRCLARPGMMRLAEWGYSRVARNRRVFSVATRVLWGPTVCRPTWRIAREVLLSGLAIIHLIAILSLWVQVDGLLGSRGVLPAGEYLERAGRYFDQAKVGWDRYRQIPTLLWLGAGHDRPGAERWDSEPGNPGNAGSSPKRTKSDVGLHLLCGLGVVLALLALSGYARAPACFGLWAIYLSLVSAGQDFMAFQWDALLLEATVLAVFLSPWRLGRRVAQAAEPSRWARGLFIWLLFRLMFESGAVKLLSGDSAWRDGSALLYHYWTQPLPGPLAWSVQQLPDWVHRASCLGMFVIELVLPFFVIGPRRLRLLACVGLASLQVAILATGNYTFFNLLSLLLCLALVDDATWRRWRRRPATEVANVASRRPPPGGERWRGPALAGVAILAGVIGGAPLAGMFVPTWDRPTRALESWLAPLRSFNGYGLFAVMTTRRPEIIIEGSVDGMTWVAYEFRFKPGAVDRRPAQVAPHQPRLDWQLWFAALGEVRHHPWFIQLCRRLLEGSPPVLALIGDNPFVDRPPAFIRARLYEYRFATPEERRATGAWWVRSERGTYCPPLSLRMGNAAGAAAPL